MQADAGNVRMISKKEYITPLKKTSFRNTKKWYK
jgi:hypothetical protein